MAKLGGVGRPAVRICSSSRKLVSDDAGQNVLFDSSAIDPLGSELGDRTIVTTDGTLIRLNTGF